MADVRRRLHGGAADVDRRPARHERDEVADRAGGGVVQAEAHCAGVYGRPAGARASPARTQRGRDRGQALAAAGEAQPVGGGGRTLHRRAAAPPTAPPPPRPGAARAAGRSPITCTATLPTAPAGRGEHRADVSEQGDAATRRPSAGRRCRTARRGRRGRPRRAGRRSGVRGDVAVGVPGAAVDARPVQPGQPAGAAGLDRVDVGADADPQAQLAHRRAAPRPARRSARSLGAHGDLGGALVAGHGRRPGTPAARTTRRRRRSSSAPSAQRGVRRDAAWPGAKPCGVCTRRSAAAVTGAGDDARRRRRA